MNESPSPIAVSGGDSVAARVLGAKDDAGPCLNKGDAAACVGLGFGLTGTVLGGAGAAGSILAAAGVIGETSLGSAILGGLGASGLNIGIAGTVVDVVNAFAGTDSEACPR